MSAERGVQDTRWRGLWYGLAIVLAVFVYFFDLDGQHIPRNGDEDPYAHITRLTAQSGQLLPLQSELDGMRNTKPPLLFWQGIASTHWGQEWTLWNLRYPSVLYSLATALLCYLLASRLTGERRQGACAALAFLAFLSTYRFGRPFLTNAPEVFWLFLPFFLLLYLPRAFTRRGLPPLLGAVIGVGLLYKSFALLLPVGLTLAWWYWHEREYRWREFLVHDVWKLASVALIALAMFALWFVFDPQPQAVWQEFVVKENAGKLDARGAAYFAKLLWGASSFWTLLLGFPMNAGLLAFPVVGLMQNALRRPSCLAREEKLLWIWILVMLVVFSLPSQRSARYLLPAMPALAVLCALGWQRIGRYWFVLSLASVILLDGVLAFFAWRVRGALPQLTLFGWTYWALLGGNALLALLACWRAELTRPATPFVVLLAWLALAAFLRPFDGPLGRFDASAQAAVQGREVRVPYDFNAGYEDYRFVLPGARIVGYVEQRDPDLEQLAASYPLFAVRQTLSAPPCDGCRVLGERLELRGRQSPDELKAIARGEGLENLFLRERLIESPRASGRP